MNLIIVRFSCKIMYFNDCLLNLFKCFSLNVIPAYCKALYMVSVFPSLRQALRLVVNNG